MEFRLLGPLRVHDGQQVRPVPAAKQRVVLAALLLRGGSIVGVDELIRTIWDATPPDGALIALRNHVMRARRVVGPDLAARLHTRPPGYLIDVHDGELDLRTFIQLRERGGAEARAGRWEQARAQLCAALGLWRGDPLLDVPSERLRGREGRRLVELRLDALRERIDADLQLGEHQRLVAELQDLVREHPLREGFHAQLMLALYRSGRQSEALAAYQTARHTLIEDVGVEPGQELILLHKRMLTLDPTLDATPPASSSIVVSERQPPPHHPAPAQLPPDLADFTGRADTTAYLGRLLRQDASGAPVPLDTPGFPDGSGRSVGPGAVVVLTGPGGIGKTSLAVHVAHRLREHFPDGQLYVNLHASAEVPPGSDAVAARLLRDLGVDPARIPTDVEERDNLYRSLLATRRVLLVLDDARDPAQVRPLLPGSPHCAVLVTSRNRLSTLSTSGRVDLDILDRTESTALIGRIIGSGRAGTEPDAVEDLLRACAGLPLAIRIAAARLVARPTQTIRSFADRLTDARARLDQLEADDLGVRATFTISYTPLPPRTARAFRLLGMWPGPDLSATAAAALLAEPAPVGPASGADYALEALIDAQLLQSPAPGRYRLHDLLHVYARERAQRDESPGDRDSAVHRVVSWFLYTMVNADLRLRPHRTPLPLDPAGPDIRPLAFDDYAAALAWCQREQANLVAAVRTAEAHALHRHAWQLTAALWSFYYITKRREDWLATGDIGLRSARKLDDPLAQGAMLANLGTALCECRRYDEAIEGYKQALVLHRAAGDRSRQPSTLNSLAVAYGETGQFALALDAFDRIREMQTQAGNFQGEALALSNMALCYAELGQPGEAVRYNQRALSAYRSLGDRYCEAICLANLGEAHAQTGAHPLALRLFAEAVTIHAETGNQHGRARTLLSLGRSQAALAQPLAAQVSWREAHAVFVSLGQPEAEETLALLAEAAESADAVV